MAHIFIVNEDNHGDIGYSLTLSGAYDCLIKSKWIDKHTEIWDDRIENTCTLEEKFGNAWEYCVRDMDLNTFNGMFDSLVQIRVEPLWR